MRPVGRLKLLLLFTFTALLCSLASAVEKTSPFIGSWEGKLALPGADLAIVFHITSGDGQAKATMDVPAQGVISLPAEVALADKSVTVYQKQLGIRYRGSLHAGGINGRFTQAGQSYVLNLRRLPASATPQLRRPQHPQGPIAYISENIEIRNEPDRCSLQGTLSYPKSAGRKPAVILISGSGQQDRDGTIFGHKTLLVLAHHLTELGLAVLRYDDRGVGGSQACDLARATSEDFSRDVVAAYQYLRRHPSVDPEQIGLLGHSEGAMIAQLVASKNSDIAFVVFLAGPGVPGDELYAKQLYRAWAALPGEKASALDYEDFRSYTRLARQQAYSKRFESLFYAMNPGASAKIYQNTKATLSSPWFQYFLQYDPGPRLAKIQCPVLAINGQRDVQVDAESNLTAIASILEKSDHPDFEVRRFAELNHLFQTAETGMPAEYALIEETFSPLALASIKQWLRERFIP